MSSSNGGFEQDWTKEKKYCLLVGSGATRSFVGTWSELLNKLLSARLINRWLDSKNPNHDINTINSLIQSRDTFTFFEGEGNLENGDYLLSDDRKSGVFKSNEEKLAWLEKYFSSQVSLVLKNNTRNFCLNPLKGKRDKCDTKECHYTCPIYNGRVLNVADLFIKLKESNKFDFSLDREKREETFENCSLYKELSSLMTIIELCLSGAVRFIINYNFDTIIEQILADDTVIEKFYKFVDGGEKLHIHIWVDGQSSDKLFYEYSSEKYVLRYHVGEELCFNNDLMDKNSVHFFHVHGVGGEPDEWKEKMNGIEKICPIVFSEHSYIEYQKASFNWSNRTLSCLMNNFSIVTVGFSGEDANFRSVARTLKSSKLSLALTGEQEDNNKVYKIVLLRNRSKHKKKFKKAIQDCAGSTLLKEDQIEEQAEFFSQIYENMVTNYYKNYFDITVRWEKDHTRIAGLLMERVSKVRV